MTLKGKITMSKFLKFKNRVNTNLAMPEKKAALTLIVMYGLMYQANAMAALPWESPFRQVVQSICGPIVQGFAIAILVGTGIAIGFLESKGWLHNLFIALFGIAVAINAPAFLTLIGSSSVYAC